MAEEELQTQVAQGEPPVAPPQGGAPLPPQDVVEKTPPVVSAPDPALIAQAEDFTRQLAEKDTELQGHRTRASQYAEWDRERQVEAHAKTLMAQKPLWDEETAKTVAQAQYDAWFAREQAKNADTNARTLYQGQVLEAIELAKKYGGSVEELLKLSRSEMKLQAKNMGEIATLKETVAKLVKAQVPAQTFESGQSGGGGGTSLEALLAKDTRKMNSKELAEYNKQFDEALLRGK